MRIKSEPWSSSDDVMLQAAAMRGSQKMQAFCASLDNNRGLKYSLKESGVLRAALMASAARTVLKVEDVDAALGSIVGVSSANCIAAKLSLRSAGLLAA